MANVGSLNWLVKMEKAARAKSKAKEVTDEFDEMGDKARQADRAVEDLNDSTDNAGGKMSSFGRRLGLTTGMLGLLTSGLLGAGNALLRLLGISIGGGALSSLMTFIKGISIASVAGKLKWLGAVIKGVVVSAIMKLAYGAGVVVGALEWMVASGGALAAAGWAIAAAIGAVIGLFGVWILEITGVLDWIGKLGEMLSSSLPDWATEGIITLISLLTGPLAALGGFIVGFIRGGFDKGMEMAWQIVKIQVRAIWNTFARLWNLLKSGFSGFVSWLKGLFAGVVNWLLGAWRKFTTYIGEQLSKAQRFVHDLKNAIQAGLRGALNAVKNPIKTVKGFLDDAVTAATNFFNDVAPKPLKDAFRWVEDKVQWLIDKMEDLIDTLQDAADTVNEVNPASEGSAANNVVDSTAAFVDPRQGWSPTLKAPWEGASGGIVTGPTPAFIGEGGEKEAVMPLSKLDAMLANAGGGGGGGGGKTLIIKEQVIEIGDQTLDISELGRAEMEELASLISEKQHNTFQSATF
jgi:phage-related protein